jgi:hypothetical protein
MKKDNVKDAEEKLGLLAKEINNEKEMTLQADIRQSNSINDHTYNQVNMSEIHQKTLSLLQFKIKEVEDRKLSHKKQADKNDQNLRKEKKYISADTNKRTIQHKEYSDHKFCLISKLEKNEPELINQKNINELQIVDLNNYINKNRLT